MKKDGLVFIILILIVLISSGLFNIKKTNTVANFEYIKYIKRWWNVNAKDKDWRTPLMGAILIWKKEIVDLLIKKWADVNAKNKDWGTPLMYAIKWWKKEIVDLLIKNWVDVNAKDKYWRTPLMYAIWKWNKDIIDLLKKAWAR